MTRESQRIEVLIHSNDSRMRCPVVTSTVSNSCIQSLLLMMDSLYPGNPWLSTTDHKWGVSPPNIKTFFRLACQLTFCLAFHWAVNWHSDNSVNIQLAFYLAFWHSTWHLALYAAFWCTFCTGRSSREEKHRRRMKRKRRRGNSESKDPHLEKAWRMKSFPISGTRIRCAATETRCYQLDTDHPQHKEIC